MRRQSMHRHLLVVSLSALAFFCGARQTNVQTNPANDRDRGAASYRLNVSVDEVSLTFHAADAHGLPVNDLKLSELKVLDNEKQPRRIIAFNSLQDFPIRAGILIDTSESIEE